MQDLKAPLNFLTGYHLLLNVCSDSLVPLFYAVSAVLIMEV